MPRQRVDYYIQTYEFPDDFPEHRSKMDSTSIAELSKARVLVLPHTQVSKNMILHQFRKHLADELRNFPLEPNAATQSYAVTTASLARKILDYLNAKDLTLPNGFGIREESPTYKLATVLARILHFRTLGQDSISFEHPGKPDLITLYSDKHMRFKEHLYIRLTDYLDAMNRLATDDLFVARYLLRHTVTLLSKALKAKEPQSRQEEVELTELRRSIYGYVANAWDMLCLLSDTGKVEIEPSSIDCYEDLYDKGSKKYARFPTSREFVEGYLRIWRWAPFNPSLVEIEGLETYCMLLNEIEPKEDGTIRGLAIPFATFIRLFADVRQQVGQPTKTRQQ